VRERQREREREKDKQTNRERETERERGRNIRSPRHEQCARVTCVLRAIYIHYSDYTLPSFRVARLLINKRLPRVRLHVPSIWALVAAIARSLARAARVDSFHLCRLGCEESERARERDSENARESASARVRKSQRQRERIHRRSFVNTTRLLTIYLSVPRDCYETARQSERERGSEKEGAKERERERAGESERATPIHAVFGVVVIDIVIVKVNDGMLDTIAFWL